MSPSGVDLLHHPAELLAADRSGLLPAAATAGAQVRAVHAALGELPALQTPRALVVVGPQVAAEVDLLRAAVDLGATAPVVAVQLLPSWVGALDVVVVLAGRVHDPLAAQAAEIAVRRGAQVVVRASAQAPSPGSGSVLLRPQLAVSEAMAAPARLAVLFAVAHRCGLTRTEPDLLSWADALDAISLACHPSAEEFVNPGVALAEYLAGGVPLLIGADPMADAVAAVGVRLLADLAGAVAGMLPSAAALESPAILRRAAIRPDMFADPLDDQPAAAAPSAPLVISLDSRSPSTLALTGALPRALVLAPEDSDPSGQPSPGSVQAASSAVELLLRLTFAAVYLGLTVGQLAPLDSPDGLGRPGTALGALRPEERGAFAPIRDLEQDRDCDDARLDDDFLRSIDGGLGPPMSDDDR